MVKRTKYIFANWKMNLTIGEASLLMYKLEDGVTAHRDVEVVLFPSLLGLQTLSLQASRRKFKLGAQNFYWRDHGAFTGEISAHQLRGLVQYALVGHSERRHLFHEHGRDIGRKMQAAIRNHITPVLCVGETASERSNNEMKDVLHDQIVAGLANLTSDDLENVVIAYEPVWAIGTGDNASPRDVEEAARVIRAHIAHLYGAKVAKEIPVLYGGSVDNHNAGSYLETHGIDGLLIGGASLKPDIFSAIVKRAHEVK